jgi:hypothetical protein
VDGYENLFFKKKNLLKIFLFKKSFFLKISQDLFLYSYIPFAIMLVSTIIIIYRLFTISRRLRRRKSTTRGGPEAGGRLPSNRTVCTKKLPASEMAKNSDELDDSDEVRPNSVNFKLEETAGVESKLLGGGHNSSNQLTVITAAGGETSLASPRAKSRTTVSNKSSAVSTRNNSDIAKRRTKKNSQVYKLLLTLNVCFFVLVTPLVLSNSLGYLHESATTTEIFYIFAYLNHCLNFLFYGVSCKVFRTILIDTLKKMFHCE